MARVNPYGDDVKKEQEELESDRAARETLRETLTKVQQEKRAKAVELANQVFEDIVVPAVERLFGDLQEATPRMAGQWERREDHFDGGTRLFAFWTPKEGDPKFKVTALVMPEDDVLRATVYCEPNDSPRASVLPVTSEPKAFQVANFRQAGFTEWLHGRLQKCGNIGLAVLRPQSHSD